MLLAQAFVARAPAAGAETPHAPTSAPATTVPPTNVARERLWRANRRDIGHLQIED